MEILEDPARMVARATEARARGQRIGLVPTMGFLHPGHASLMDRIRSEVDLLVVSIYVNPLQFAPGEDLDRYPTDRPGDAQVCRDHGVDLVFAPADLYPDGFSTSVEVHGLTDGLCGAKRPGHFTGVATVCARLFGLTRCDRAVFGEKDFQQLAVLRRMVRDLALPLQIVAAPVVRDPDGVAMSSRNSYLRADQRARASSLHRALAAMQRAAAAGTHPVADLVALGRAQIDADRIDYLEVVAADDLAPIHRIRPGRPARALVAAFYGDTRLIDNVALHAPDA